MHGTLLGIVKMLTSLWFDKTYKKQPWYIGSYVPEMDVELKSIKIPNSISRSPRSLIDERAQWKASEYCSFLLFYSTPLLWKRLPNEYFQHYILLVEAIFLLLKQSITVPDLQHSSLLLKKFYILTRRLYGERYYTYNMHNLVHLVDCVKDLGPLWTFSCFFYEDLNGDLRHLFHGTQSIHIQIVTSITFQQQIPEMELLFKNSRVEDFFMQMTHKHHYKIKTTHVENITPTIAAVGKLKPLCLNGKLYLSVTNFCGPIKECFIFYRVQTGKNVYHSSDYSRVKKRNSHTIMYSKDGQQYFGYIQYYIKCLKKCGFTCCTNCACQICVYIAVIERTIPAVHTKLPCLGHINIFKKNQTELDLCLVTDVKEMCVSIKTMDVDLICNFPNIVESD